MTNAICLLIVFCTLKIDQRSSGLTARKFDHDLKRGWGYIQWTTTFAKARSHGNEIVFCWILCCDLWCVNSRTALFCFVYRKRTELCRRFVWGFQTPHSKQGLRLLATGQRTEAVKWQVVSFLHSCSIIKMSRRSTQAAGQGLDQTHTWMRQCVSFRKFLSRYSIIACVAVHFPSSRKLSVECFNKPLIRAKW